MLALQKPVEGKREESKVPSRGSLTKAVLAVTTRGIQHTHFWLRTLIIV
jgi:hypothetical protein